MKNTSENFTCCQCNVSLPEESIQMHPETHEYFCEGCAPELFVSAVCIPTDSVPESDQDGYANFLKGRKGFHNANIRYGAYGRTHVEWVDGIISPDDDAMERKLQLMWEEFCRE